MKSLFFTLLLTTYLQSETSFSTAFNNKLITFSQNDLKNLYLKKTNTVKGIHLIPIDSNNKKAFFIFSKKIINKTPKQLYAYWIKQIYKGDKQPPSRKLPKSIGENVHFLTYKLASDNKEILLTIK